MNLQQLRYFVVVAEELHFGRAAQRLHMAQPPLSQQIRRLEADLGQQLFERTTRRVALTEAGRLLHAEATQLLRNAKSVEHRMAQLRNGEGGVLRLGFVDSASYQVLPRFLQAYRSAWPAVEYELRSQSSDEQQAALLAAEIDLGIARTAPSAAIGARPFLHERLCIAVPADHRLASQKSVTLGRLRGETFLGFDRTVSPSLYADMVAMFARHEVAYDPIIEATEYTTVLGLVASGQGIAAVPVGVQTFQPPNLAYIHVRDTDAISTLHLLYRREEGSTLVAHAIDVVTQQFGNRVVAARP